MMNWGTWVVFPHPVSPATSTTLLAAIASRICCLWYARTAAVSPRKAAP